MIAQTIEGVIQPSIDMIDNNETSSSFLNEFDTVLLDEKINIATTLALLVGLFQVSFHN